MTTSSTTARWGAVAAVVGLLAALLSGCQRDAPAATAEPARSATPSTVPDRIVPDRVVPDPTTTPPPEAESDAPTPREVTLSRPGRTVELVAPAPELLVRIDSDADLAAVDAAVQDCESRRSS